MPIDAGDVVLTAVLDLGNLDQGLDSIRTKVPGAFQGAAEGAKQFNQELDATGENAEFAGEQIQESFRGARSQIYEAKGELGLIGELFGIHLPRHVRTFIAELPGIGTALSAAFAATAVIFIVEAIAKGIEKLKEWSEASHKLELGQEEFQTSILKSFNNLDEKLLESGIKLDDLRGNHLAALHKELQLINLQKLDQLEGEFDKLAKTSDAMFKLLEGHWYLLDSGSTGAKNALVEFKAKYDLLLAEAQAGDKGAEKKADDLLAGTLRVAQAFLTTLEAGKKAADELQVELAKSGHATGPVGGPTEKEIESQRVLIGILQAQVTAREKINQLAKDKKTEVIEKEDKREASEEIKLQKEIADAHQKAQKEIQQVTAQTAKMQAEMTKQQKKDDDDARKDRLENLKRREQGWIEELDGEIQAERAAVEQKALLLKTDYDARRISGQRYLSELKALYAQETTALLQMLEHKKQIVIAEAITEAALRGKTLKAEDAAELKEVIAIENQKAKVRSDAATRTAKAMDDLAKHEAKALSLRPQWDKFFQDLIKGSLSAGQAMRRLGEEVKASIGASVEAAVSGSEGFGAAMEQILKSALASLAGYAVVKVIDEMARGFSDLADPFMAAHAPLHFHAAEIWGLVGAAAGIGGAALPGGNRGGSGASASSSGGSGPTIDHGATANQPAQQPVQTQNVAAFASGGLAMRPMMATVAEQGPEAVLPLNDAVMGRLAAAIAAHGGAGGEMYIELPPGLNLKKTVYRISRMQSKGVNEGKLRLRASDSLRYTPRHK